MLSKKLQSLTLKLKSIPISTLRSSSLFKPKSSFSFHNSVVSAIFIPGNQQKMLNKLPNFNSDIMVPDCEDSVPEGMKKQAREMIHEFISKNESIPKLISNNTQIMPRINDLNTQHWKFDVDGLITDKTIGKVGGLTVPKIESEEQIIELDQILGGLEKKFKKPLNSIKLLVWIESTLGIINMNQIFKAGRNRIIASAFGAEDYYNNFTIPRTASMKEIDIVRNLFAITSHAHSIIAMDSPYVEYTNSNGLVQEINHVRNLGFKGKFAIHPSQIDIINKHFKPSEEEIAEARLIVSEYEKGLEKGIGAITVNGKMVDMPVYRRALGLLNSLY